MCAWTARWRAGGIVRMRTYPPPSVRDPQCPNSPPFSGIGVAPFSSLPGRLRIRGPVPFWPLDPGSGAYLTFWTDLLKYRQDFQFSKRSLLAWNEGSLNCFIFYIIFSTTSFSKLGCLDLESWVLIWIDIPHWFDSRRSGSVLEIRNRIQAQIKIIKLTNKSDFQPFKTVFFMSNPNFLWRQSLNRIRIRLDPHWFLSLDADPHWGKRLDPDPHHVLLTLTTAGWLLSFWGTWRRARTSETCWVRSGSREAIYPFV
jgi:hypothetical protein